MTAYAAIDLSKLATPDVVEMLDFEAILAAMVTDLQARWPEFSALVESDPAYKILQVAAYREVLMRARVNEGARASMLATATGADLDNLAALLGVSRLIVTPADPDAVPPVAAVLEADAALRARAQLALEGFSTAGPRGAYQFHALSASGEVLDASVISPVPGDVLVTVLSRSGDGTAAPELVATVAEALNDDDVRPLCDHVTVQGASIIPYQVEAELVMFDGPDPEVARAAAEAAVQAYADESHRLGRAVRLSALYRALHQPGVESVTLIAPVADIECTTAEAAYCGAVAVTIGAGA